MQQWWILPQWWPLVALPLSVLWVFWPARCRLLVTVEVEVSACRLHLELLGIAGVVTAEWRRKAEGRTLDAAVQVKILRIITWEKRWAKLPLAERVVIYVWQRWQGKSSGDGERSGRAAGGRGGGKGTGSRRWARGVNALVAMVPQGMRIARDSAEIDLFKVGGTVGLGDAAATARLTGSLWQLTGIIVGGIQGLLTWRTEPEITIRPDFQRREVAGSLAFGVRMRQGWLMVLLGLAAWNYVRLLFVPIRRRKGSKPVQVAPGT